MCRKSGSVLMYLRIFLSFFAFFRYKREDIASLSFPREKHYHQDPIASSCKVIKVSWDQELFNAYERRFYIEELCL